MLAQGSRRTRPSRCAGRSPPHEPYAWTRGWRAKRSAGAAVQTENGEKPRSSWTPMQTEFRLLARLTYCGRNANYCVMRIAECPDGRRLRITSSLAITGFQEMRPVSALLRAKGDA